MSDVPMLVLVDGSSYLYRAFFALPPLNNSRGEPTGAIYGVINMLLKLVREQKPQLMAVVFDTSGKTFRDELFDQYKATRKPMPDDMRPQIEPLQQIVRAMGLPLLRIEGVEADDVIGTLARRAAKDGIKVLISTGDKDMAQLVDERTTLVNTMTGLTMDREGVKTKFDVYPEQIVDYLSLVGDSSDNIPGVDKVGQKTAAKWLGEYGTLANLLAHAGDIKGKVGENLRASFQAIELSRKLATIHCDVPLEYAPRDLALHAPDTQQLRALYERLELNSLLRQLKENTPAAEEPAADTAEGTTTLDLLDIHSSLAPIEAANKPLRKQTDPLPPAPIARHYEAIFTMERLEHWIEILKAAPLFSFDTETTSLNYMRAELVGVSFCAEPGYAAYIPFIHRYPGTPPQLDRDKVLALLKPLLEDPLRPKVGHHMKYDTHVLRNHGIELGGVFFDSMLESYVCNSTATRHDMDSVSRHYLGVTPISFEEVCGKGKGQITFDQVPVPQAMGYSAEDADVTLQLHRTIWPQISRLPKLKTLYEKIEQPLMPVLVRMEENGVFIDREMLKKQSIQLANRMRELELDAHREAGGPFNLDSPKQLQAILFEKLQIPSRRKTPKGQPSTAEDVLEELAEEYPLPKLIMEYRGLAKLKSTYTDKLPDQIEPSTGRIHASFHQALAVTGRIITTDPNLQHIPIRTQEGRRIRQAFIAPPGKMLLSADYSQIELRIMAHLSADDGLLKAFAEERDIHQATAAEVFGVPLHQVSHQQRRSAKAINFGLIYGMSAFGLARQLGIERSEAQQYIDLYFERYPGVKRYMEETRNLAREEGFVETVYGRRLYLQDIRSKNGQSRQYAERAAINAPMQGTAADIIKRAMIEVDRWIRVEHAPVKIIMQVHDELVFEIGEDSLKQVAPKLQSLMTDAAELAVPLKVEIGAGHNWDEAH